MELLASTKTKETLTARAATASMNLEPEDSAVLHFKLQGILELIGQVDQYKKPLWELRSPIPSIKLTLITLAEDILRPYEL